MLELGFASIDITPTCPVDLIGFSNRRSSQGVAQPLIAQVAVLRMDGFSCLLAAIDHIGFGIETRAKAKAKFRQADWRGG